VVRALCFTPERLTTMTPPLLEMPQPATQPDLGNAPPGTGRLRIDAHGVTDPGRVRPVNEDQFLIASLTNALQVQETSLTQGQIQCGKAQGHLLAVADGMGGHAGGRHASALAVRCLEQFVLEMLHWCSQERTHHEVLLLDEFRKAVVRADARMFRESVRQPNLQGMGTTLTVACCIDDELFIAHVGDSRCYLLRYGQLCKLTRDHTLVDEMVRHGWIAPEEAATHPMRNVVTNVLGGNDPGVDVEVRKEQLQAGDVLLLCSDGLTEMVTEDEIRALMLNAEGPAETCTALIGLANERGGRDNITAVVARFEAAA
jgi:PPM family protein phosphatase